MMLSIELEQSEWQQAFILINAGSATLQAGVGPPLLAKMSQQLQAQQLPQGNGQQPQPGQPTE